MGILSGLLGNASEMDSEKLAEFNRLLAEGERIEKGFQIIRDSFIFTNKRLILVDVQGLTGSKVEYHSYPYKSIAHFSIETAGAWDLDAELKLWIGSNPAPVQKQFNKKVNVYELQSLLASYVLR